MDRRGHDRTCRRHHSAQARQGGGLAAGQAGLEQVSDSFPILKVEQEVWSDERMDFRVRAMGQVAAGNIQVGDTHVRLEVTLPWLLHKFAQVVQKTIAAKGQILLEKK